MDIPFIRVTDLKREIHGITKEEALSIAHKGDISLCVFLDSGDRLSTVPAPYNDVFCFENDYAEVSGNVNGGKGTGLFKITDSEVFGKLFNGKKDIHNIFHEVQVSPYGVEFSKYMGLPQEYFGDDPLSKLVIPSQELDKLVSGKVTVLADASQDADQLNEDYWADKESMRIIIQDLCDDLRENYEKYWKPTRNGCLKSIRVLAGKVGAFKRPSGNMCYGQVKKIVQDRQNTTIQKIVKEAFDKFG